MLIEMNGHTVTVTLHCITLSTVKSKLQHVRPVYRKRASELLMLEGTD